MNTQKYVMLTVGLIVGIVLISGVVVPVISNVSSDSGGSTVTYRNDTGDWNIYYRSVDTLTDDDSFTILPVWDESAGMSSSMFVETYTDLTEVQRWEPLDTLLYFNENSFINKLYMAGSQAQQSAWFYYNNVSTKTNSLQYYDGGFYIPVGTSLVTMQSIPDVKYFTWYEGNYVCSFPYDPDVFVLNRYVDRSSEIYFTGIYDGSIQICVTGSADDPHAAYYDFFTDEYAPADSVTFNIENDVLRTISVTIEGVEYTIWVSYTSEEAETIDWDVDIDGSTCLVPVEVTVSSGSGSGSSGVSPVLSNILSVIPLVMAVGLVIGAITFIRRS